MTDTAESFSDASSTIQMAGAEARALMEDVVTKLDRATAAGEGKFFPNGIELIYLKLEAGLTEKTKVVVELKVAGEKGLKLAELEAEPTSPPPSEQ